ncbi:hypothetical protein M0804_000474 [Polistes exclamans]|nr:hypothetical protein M0804_000474 [Polistes exclamans]
MERPVANTHVIPTSTKRIYVPAGATLLGDEGKRSSIIKDTFVRYLQWVEESFTNFDKGINWRSYVVCDVAYNNVNNWLWTPFIERGPANRMYIEIKFTTRDCSLFPGNALSCKETFSLLYYEFDAATKEPPPWEPDSYKLIGRIAAGEGRFNTNTEVVINTEIKSVPVTKKGIYFAFRDQGACISLLAIKVYYISCPEISVNFAHYPATPTGREVAVVEQTIGTCVENAIKIETPTFLCKGDGKWYLPSGGCHCKPGYQADVEQQQCIQCPIGRFKHEAGPHSCEECPNHSKSTEYAITECRCDTDYYRAVDDPKIMPCTQPPSAPQNLTVNFVDQSTVILSWNAPHKLGGRTDTTYRVVCDACSMGVKYIPNTEIFNDTKITITGLNAVTTYRFQVFAENGVSAQAGKSEYVDITVTTEASVPSLVSNVRITSVKSSELSISWDAPVTEVGGDSDHVERYEVRCYPRFDDAINATVIQTSDLSATFKGLKPSTDYAIQVRAKTTRGWGEYTPVIYKKTPHAMGLDYVGEDDNMQVRIIAGAVVAVVVLLVIIIVLTVLFLRSRASDECNKKQPSDCDTLEYRNGEVTTPLFTPAVGVTGAGAGGTGGTGARSYVDPHTYEDPNQAASTLFFWANSLWFWFCGVFGTRLRTATTTTATIHYVRYLLRLQRDNNNSVRPPAHNPYYVTSHTAAAQAAAAAAAAAATAAASAASAAVPVPGAPTTGPFPVDVVGHQAHQAQSAIAVPVMPPGAARSLHYHTHAATHALPHQPPLTYPNWVPFTHFG